MAKWNGWHLKRTWKEGKYGGQAEPWRVVLCRCAIGMNHDDRQVPS